MMNAASCSQEYESEEDSTEWCDVVTVFWDINGFPVPYGVDAGSICRDIIKCLQAFKHSGPFTIEVFGLLTHVPTDVLRTLSSYGIILKNVPFDFTGIINQWISVNTPPANLLVFFTPYYSETSYKFLTSSSQQGYNITVTFHYSEWWDLCYGAGETDDTGSETDDTGSETDDTGSETDDTDDSWFCSVSHEMSGKSIDDLITHLSQEHELKPTEIVAGVTVFWDINSYPVPFCCEARHVCLTIKNLLEKYYYGPFTIYAIGLLTRVPADVLRALSSSGIILKNVAFDFTDIMNQWISVNPPPANTLVLSPYDSETFAKFVAPLKEQGYNIMVPQLNYSDWEQFCLEASETLKEEDKCSETDSSWVCSLCQDISGKSFENFMTHLYQEHVHEELMKKRMKEKREAFEAGGEAPLDSRPDTVWVERLSVLAAPSECHEKEEAVEALFKKQRKARMPQKMKLKRRIKKAFEAGDEALMNTMSDKGCHEKKQRKAKMKPKMKMKWRIKR